MSERHHADTVDETATLGTPVPGVRPRSTHSLEISSQRTRHSPVIMTSAAPVIVVEEHTFLSDAVLDDRQNCCLANICLFPGVAESAHAKIERRLGIEPDQL